MSCVNQKPAMRSSWSKRFKGTCKHIRRDIDLGEANGFDRLEEISSIFSQISSLGAELLPSVTLVPELAAAVPASVTSALFNPALQSSLTREFLNPTGSPAWFSSLSPDAQAYLLGVPAKEASIIPAIVSFEMAAGFSTLILPSAPTYVPTVAFAVAETTTTSIVATSTSTTSEQSTENMSSVVSSSRADLNNTTIPTRFSTSSTKSSSK
jgi:hypothetical protein